MTKLKADNIPEILEQYFKGEARLTGTNITDTITFKFCPKPKPRLEDSQGRLYDLNDPEIEQFISKMHTPQKMKFVRVRNFEFETIFDFPKGYYKLLEIALFSTDFDFVGENVYEPYFAKGPLLRVRISPKPFTVADFSIKMRGYLNRLGKRKYISLTEVGMNEIESLLEFIPRQSNPLARPNEIDKKKKLQYLEYFLAQINKQGREKLKKMTKMLKKRDIFEHVITMKWKDETLLHQIGSILIKRCDVIENEEQQEQQKE